MKIRDSRRSDRSAIRGIHHEAFGPEQGAEIADLVDALLDDETARPLLSLVADTGDGLVGHVLFTAARIHPGGPDGPDVSARILAPLAVSERSQGAGIGGALVADGLERLSDLGVELVFVLGHPTYYPRFGFRPAGPLGLRAPHPIAPENADAWMVKELDDGVVERVEGVVRCAVTLEQPQHWQE